MYTNGVDGIVPAGDGPRRAHESMLPMTVKPITKAATVFFRRRSKGMTEINNFADRKKLNKKNIIF